MKKLSAIELTQRVTSIYSSAISFKSTAKEIRQQLDQQVWQELASRTPAGKNRYSSYIRGYVSGYQMALYEDIMRNHVEFCYEYDGELYSTYRHTTHRSVNEFYETGNTHILSKCDSNFYWLHTNKPYIE